MIPLSRALAAAALALSVLSATPVRAQGTDPADLAYWEAIKNSQETADYKDYLDRFPHGTFAPIARSRLQHLAGGTRAPAAPFPAPGGTPARTDPALEPEPTDAVQEQLFATPAVIHVGDKVRISWKNLPAGDQFAIINVVRAGSPEAQPTDNRPDMKILQSQYVSSYRDQGYYEFGPFAPGKFEARYVTTLYNDDRKPEVRAKTTFTVR